MDNNNTLSTTDQLKRKIPHLPKEACLPDGLGSDACDWLDEYVDFSKKWSPESYDGYHEACGLFVLSTVAARRVVYNLGSTRATNLSILLVGRTSIHAKSTAAEIGIDLLRDASLDWMLAPDEITPQKLIEVMSSITLPRNYNELDEEGQQRAINRVLTAGQRGWFLDEFGGNLSSMMQPDSVMSGIKGLIRKLDSAPPKYDYSTISRDQNLIRNPYLAILGNITVDDLIPYAKKGAALWGNGFLPRFAMVVPPADQLNYGEFPNEERKFPRSLLSALINWNARLGLPEYRVVEHDGQQNLIFQPIMPTNLSISSKVYEAYYNYHKALKMMIVSNQNHDLDGNYARLDEKALRIAALFASINDLDTIGLNHWAKAQAITERWRVGLHELHRQINDIYQDQVKKYVKSLTIEQQILRAVGRKQMPDKREICQFTGKTIDIVEPALASLISENKLKEIGDNGKKRYILPE